MAFVRCTQREMNTDHQILSEWGIAMNSGSRVVGTSRVTKILSCGKDGGWYMFGGSKYLCYTTLHYITLPYTVECALSSLRRRRACSKYCCNQSGSDYGWTIIDLLPLQIKARSYLNRRRACSGKKVFATCMIWQAAIFFVVVVKW